MNAATPNIFSIDGKTIVITGGYGQIGRRFVHDMHELGAKIAVLEPFPSDDRSREMFGDLAVSERLGVFKADVTDRNSLVAACDAISDTFGALDGLVNNAALDSPPDAPAEETGPFETYPEASWDKVMDVNVKGVFQACQVFGAAMAEAGGGSIVNVTSIYGAVSPDQSLYQYRRDRGEIFYKPVAYAASKSALYNLSRYVAVYWGARNVRSNTVTFAGVFNNQDNEFLSRYEKKIPLRRPGDETRHGMAEPGDFVGGVVYLLSDASAYMTGADLRLDGGFLAL